MPPVLPSRRGRRGQPGAVGGAAPRSFVTGRDNADREPAPQPRREPRSEHGREAAPVTPVEPAKLAGQSPPAGQADSPLQVGQDLEVAIEDVAQGGWCIARPEGLPVMFVRHTLPGERVVARVTEVTAKLARADAVRILEASPDRVEAPCPEARPDRCGGCDWQHASLPAQRALKANVVTQQLKRLAGIDREVTVEPLAGAENGLGWRTRVQFAVDRDGVAGLRGHRSHRVVDIADCLIAHQDIRDLDITGEEWSGAVAVEVAIGGADSADNFAVTVVEEQSQRRNKNPRRQNESRRLSQPKRTLLEGRHYLAEHAAGRLWQVSADGFWQVHPDAADTLGRAVCAALDPRPGDTVLDLYCGAGLFAGVVAPLVGPDGTVTGIESDAAAVKNARQNLSDCPWVKFRKTDVVQAVADADLPPARLVIADPPRAGLAREVVAYLAADGPAERFAYVSCDPATLARDLALLITAGWTLAELRAFDAFPMTHHVECVAVLTRSRG